MATVKEMIELLKVYPETMEVTNEQNLPFIHVVNRQGESVTLSTKQPIGHCCKCGDYAYKEDVLDYTGVCPSCDENLYDFEITSLQPTEEEQAEAYYAEIVMGLIFSLPNKFDKLDIKADQPYVRFEDENYKVYIFDLESMYRDEPEEASEIYRNHIYINKIEYYYVLDNKKLGQVRY
jgi:hypothetical protein